ncbi:MAG TPA: cytochrome c oxidase assembly protein [Acetobacteraceae bacterium]
MISFGRSANRPGKLLTVLGLLAAVAVMTTLVSYSVTLYRLFCQATGALGTTGRVAADTAAESARTVTVSFDTNVAPGLPWRFTPVQHQVQVHLGQETLVFFRAENLSDRDIVGHATFNVTPAKIGVYFKKIQCFCFTEERLGARQSVEMPVDFFVDPRMAQDHNATDVRNITLSYTFFESLRPTGAQDLARFDNQAPDPRAGAKLFATNCSACHAPDRSKVGPALAGVVGRQAGSQAGYPYSAALAHAGFAWDPARLDRWLTNPQALVPGALMPYRLADSGERRDVIAYLETLKPLAKAAENPPPDAHSSGG